jgi:hypothetical protein
MQSAASTANAPIDCTNNAWYPDGAVWWSTTGGAPSSLGAARAALPATAPLFGTSKTRHDADVALATDPFGASIALGADYLTEVMSVPALALDATSAANHAGVAIPNITDGYAGAAPDVGAVIEGRITPNIGASRP